MYFTNSERNRVVHELWEKNLTVGEISANTGIPRSTVGYYVRKFNRLAAKGKSVVFLDMGQDAGKQDSYIEGSSAKSLLKLWILRLMRQCDLQELYYRLSILRLLKELGFLTGEDRKIFLTFLAPDRSSER